MIEIEAEGEMAILKNVSFSDLMTDQADE